METVGLIGAGLLGSALAKRILAAGFTLHGYDPDPAAMRQLQEFGANTEDSAAAVAPVCNRIVLCLPTTDIVKDVVSEIESSLTAGSVVVDTTTGDPNTTRELSSQLHARSVTLIDVSVLGSSTVTADGNSLLLAGADEATAAPVERLLNAISDRVHYLGRVGAGQEMKLVANLVLGLNRAVLAEGLHFAEGFGLNPNAALEVLQAGAAYSRVMDAKGHRMIQRDFEPQARLKQHLKDVRMILELGEQKSRWLPLSILHQDILESAQEAGAADLDNSAVIEAWNRLTGPSE